MDIEVGKNMDRSSVGERSQGGALWESADDWSTVVGEIVTAGAAEPRESHVGSSQGNGQHRKPAQFPSFPNVAPEAPLQTVQGFHSGLEYFRCEGTTEL